MKKTIISFFFFLSAFLGTAQEKNEITYKITSNPSNVDLVNYTTAMDKSNFECFRFESKSRFLTFKSGVVVELFSYNQVTGAGVIQKNSCYLSDTVVENQYECDLNGEQVVMKAPYDKTVKRANYEK